MGDMSISRFEEVSKLMGDHFKRVNNSFDSSRNIKRPNAIDVLNETSYDSKYSISEEENDDVLD